MGLVTGTTIFGLLALFVLSSSNKEYNLYIVLFTTFIFSYFVIFILFYSVKLIGNCLEIFFVVNEVEQNPNKNNDLDQLYNSYRLMALEKVCLERMDTVALKEYHSLIKEQIESNSNEKESLNKRFEDHFKYVTFKEKSQ